MPCTWLLMLGSNLDDDARIHAALAALARLGPTRLASRIVRLPAYGGASTHDYYNALATLESGLERAALVADLKRIERELGRERGSGRVAIDIDLLAQREGDRWIADSHAVDKGDLAQPPTRLLLAEAGISVEA